MTSKGHFVSLDLERWEGQFRCTEMIVPRCGGRKGLGRAPEKGLLTSSATSADKEAR